MTYWSMEWDRPKHILTFYNVQTHACIHKLTGDSLNDLSSFFICNQTPIDIAMVPLNKPRLDLWRRYHPQAQLVIDPQEVMWFVKRVMGEDLWCYANEVAATADGVCSCNHEGDITQFLNELYKARSPEEALERYNAWQDVLPLNCPMTYKVLRMLEFYQVEIMNYFRV